MNSVIAIAAITSQGKSRRRCGALVATTPEGATASTAGGPWRLEPEPVPTGMTRVGRGLPFPARSAAGDGDRAIDPGSLAANGVVDAVEPVMPSISGVPGGRSPLMS